MATADHCAGRSAPLRPREWRCSPRIPLTGGVGPRRWEDEPARLSVTLERDAESRHQVAAGGAPPRDQALDHWRIGGFLDGERRAGRAEDGLGGGEERE